MAFEHPLPTEQKLSLRVITFEENLWRLKTYMTDVLICTDGLISYYRVITSGGNIWYLKTYIGRLFIYTDGLVPLV